MKTSLMLGVLLLALFNSCSKKTSELLPRSLTGKWTLYQAYGNDYWGGAAYWKNANPSTKIELTADHKYYRKYSTEPNYTLIGSYQILPNGKVQITQINPPNPSYPAYVLDYTFERGGFMTWGDFGTEALIKEKFKLDQ